jgi:methyl-accepting chemotaxis protein
MKPGFAEFKIWLINLKIKTKIILGMCIMLSLLFIFSLSTVWTISVMTRCHDLTEKSDAIINDMRLSRIYEKDFFINKDMQSVINHEKSTSQLVGHLKELLKTEKNRDFTSNINILLTLTQDYNSSFKKVVKLINQKGSNENKGLLDSIHSDETGLLNSLRRKNPKVMTDFFEIIRFANEYENNSSDDSLKNFSERILSFENAIDDQEETAMLDNYRNTFYQTVAINNQISGEIDEFNQYIGKIEPVMNKYNLYIKNFTGFIMIRSLIMSAAIFIFLMIVGLVSSMVTIKSIIYPIRKISADTGKIKQLSMRLSSIVNNNTAEITKIMTIIEVVNEFIYEQSVALNESNLSIVKMADNVGFITDIAGKEKRQIHDMNMTMKETRDDLSRLIRFVCDIRDNSGIMLETSNMISIIADKTRILAFNAGIEAANAGETGKVFRVVSEEIKKLSDQINQNAARINEQLKKNFSLIEKSADSGKNVFNDFIAFSEKAEKTTLSIIEILKKIQNIAAEKDNVMEKIGNLTMINSKVTSSGDELKTKSNELNENLASLIDVKSNTYKAINNISNVINNLVSDEKSGRIDDYASDAEFDLLKSYLTVKDEKTDFMMKPNTGLKIESGENGKGDKKLA